MRDAGYEKYEFICLLETRTCSVCGGLDGKQFPVEEAQPGVNMNPMHPNCRCFVSPVLSKRLMEAGTRGAQVDATGRKETVPASMTYQEWYGKYVKGTELEKEVARGGNSGIIKADQFHSKADPMVEVTGAGEVSNPQEIAEFRQELKDLGVTLVEREEESLAYSPGFMAGQPGTVYVSKGASYSAWCHEMQHVRDDYAAGWSGMRILRDSDVRFEREKRAYEVEIELARQVGREDIVVRLQENLDAERRAIYDE